jgi:hypothetical protein
VLFRSANNAARRPWKMIVELGNQNNAAVQAGGTVYLHLGSVNAPTTGLGALAAPLIIAIGGLADGTINTAADAVLRVSIQWSGSSASAGWTMDIGTLELVQKA